MLFSYSKILRKVSILSLCAVAFVVGAREFMPNMADYFNADKENISFQFLNKDVVVKKIKYAGFFPWFDQATSSSEEKLIFKDAKIAPNGNGILSGLANPGNSVFLKDRQNIDVGFAKSDPEGQWVAIVQKPLADATKTYSLHSQSPDGQIKHDSKQKLEIEIPEDKTLGARIKILQEGQQPIILAQNLVIPQVAIAPAALTSAALAADKPQKSSTREKVAVLKTEYQNSKEGTGKINLSGTSEKNANLTIFINEDEIGKTKADENGKWVLLEEYAAKPGSNNDVRVEQRDKNNKVLSSASSKYEHAVSATGTLGNKTQENGDQKDADKGALGAVKKEKTFWQKITGLFSGGDEEKIADQPAEKKNADGTLDDPKTAGSKSLAGGNKNAATEGGAATAGSGLASAGLISDQAQKLAQKSANAVKLAKNAAQKAAKNATEQQQGGSYLGNKDMSAGRNTVNRSASSYDQGRRGTSTRQRQSSSRSARKGRSKSARKSGKRRSKRGRRYSARHYKKRVRQRNRLRRKKRANLRTRRAARSKYSVRKRRSKRSAALRRKKALKRRARNMRKRRLANRRYLARRISSRKRSVRRRRYSKNLKRHANRRRFKRHIAVNRRHRRSRHRVATIRRSRRVRVRRGDTLWDLARIKYGHGRHYRKIYRANKRRLSSPNRLSPNQRLFLPA